MTDRAKGFFVALEDDFRVDDLEPLMKAVRCLRGVAAVTPVITNVDDWMNRTRIRTEMRDKLIKALDDGHAP